MKNIIVILALILGFSAHAHKSDKKNRVILHGGTGLTGNEVTSDADKVIIKDKRALVLGVTLGREVGHDFVVYGTIISNSTAVIGLGLDW